MCLKISGQILLQTFSFSSGYIRFPSLAVVKTSYLSTLSSEVANKTLNNSCGLPDPLAFHIIRPASDPSYPWPGTIGGGLIICIAYFAVNQVRNRRNRFPFFQLFHPRSIRYDSGIEKYKVFTRI